MGASDAALRPLNRIRRRENAAIFSIASTIGAPLDCRFQTFQASNNANSLAPSVALLMKTVARAGVCKFQAMIAPRRESRESTAILERHWAAMSQVLSSCATVAVCVRPTGLRALLAEDWVAKH
jgi:hypothetical protein